jgi:NAD(P)-dependent dehydrogenase (short-subunit alcohol dehydrogenase family)
LSERGHQVAIADLSDERLRAVASEVGRNVKYFHVDVRSEKSVAELVGNVIKSFGRVDALYAIQGIQTGHRPLQDTPLEEWDVVLDINLTGTFLCLKHVIPHMLRQSSGCLVAMATSPVREGVAPYFTSKIGLEGLIELAGFELKPTIGAYIVAPGGYLATNFHDNSFEIMPSATYLPDEELRKERKAIKPEVVVPLFTYLLEKTPADLSGKKINALDWNEANGLGRANWYL